MTPAEIQQRNNALKAKFIPSTIDLGIAVNGDKIPFNVVNTSDQEILGFTKSCGCVGEIKLEGQKITGELPAEYRDVGQFLYKSGDKYYQKVEHPTQVRWLDISNNSFVEPITEPEGPIPAYLFAGQTIGVTMKQEGVPDFIVLPNGEITENAERLKIILPIRMWVLKDPQ